MARESALRQRLAVFLRENGFFVQAIESGETGGGVPDTYYRLNSSVVGWIECKRIREIPKRADTALFKSMNHGLSTDQANWIKQELAHGGRCWILVAWERRYFIVPGGMCDQFNDLPLSRLEKWEVKKDRIPAILKGEFAWKIQENS